jgi:small subunit ribosomal protein S21
LDAVIESGHHGEISPEQTKTVGTSVPTNVEPRVERFFSQYVGGALDPFPNISSIMGFGPLAGLEVEFLAEVRVQEGEPLENALRRFKRKVQQEDIIKEVKRHSYYLKPGEKRRVKAALARKRNRKKARKEQD